MSITRFLETKAENRFSSGMVVTYKAIDTHLGCPVALKIISTQLLGNEAARSRFLREARAAASVRYLQAKQLVGAGIVALLGSEKKTLTQAISLLEEATQKDHQFAFAYCMIAKAHDNLYFDRIDHTPQRRALGDAAVNEAVRLRPDIPEVHLALAFHLYTCYRDFERTRVQVAIAAQALANNPDLLQLTADIDQVQ